MIQPAPQLIDPVLIRQLTTFVDEHPEVLELLLSVWNQATYRNTQAVVFSKPSNDVGSR